MAFEDAVETIIQEAMQRGEFDDLPGAGKPIDLTDYFNAQEDVRVAHAMLKNAAIIPIEVELLNRIAQLRTAASSASGEPQQREIRRKIAALQLELNLRLEQYRAARNVG